jgi:dTDP-4-dehydrorhamnose reductase
LNHKKTRWLVTGASGIFGHAFCQHLINISSTVIGLRNKHSIQVSGVKEIVMDLEDSAQLKNIVCSENPDWIVHAAGFTSVDGCEERPHLAKSIHVQATQTLVGVAKKINSGILYISTDHLWDGQQPFVKEYTPPHPINVYARTKLEGENIVLNSGVPAIIIRTNFFGLGRPWHPSFSDWIFDGITKEQSISMFDDVFFTPISLDYLCPAITDIVEKKGRGIFHVAGKERLSKYQFAILLSEIAGLSSKNIKRSKVISMKLGAPRPKDMSLNTSKVTKFLGRQMPDAKTSLAILFNEQSK